MSDPVTNVEIEDVLTSIRRLVAEGGSKAEGGDAAMKADQAPEKLVLTPALRVMTDNTKPRVPTPEGGATSASETPEFTSDRTTLTPETIAELEEAVTAQPDEWEPDGSEVDAEPTWESAGFDRVAESDVEDAEVIDAMAETEEVQPEGADLPDEASAASLIESDAPSEPEPIEAQRDPAPASPAPRMPEISFPRAAQDVERAIDFATRITNPHLTAATEPTFRHTPPDPEDTDFGDELAEGPIDALAQDEDLDAYLSDGAILDEAMLRALITEVLAQELQGKLGERISRNVRKLVRREIHRMLTSRELD